MIEAAPLLTSYMIESAREAARAPRFTLPVMSDEETQRSRQFSTHGAKIEPRRIWVEEERRKVWALVEVLPTQAFRILTWLEARAA